jgi:hypothetical protein
MLRAVFIFAVLALQACASAPDEAFPAAATFRRSQAIEFYDFRLNASHDGGDRAVTGRDCSNDRFHCYAGLTVLVAPRECSDVRRLLRSREDWVVGDRATARFLFLSEEQLYFVSSANPAETSSSGFVYGVIGVWRSDEASGQLNRAAANAIIDSTKWLEAPRSLFACG